MRLATYNVENMFERVKAMNLTDWAEGAQILNDFKQLSDLIERDVYTEKMKEKMLALMQKHNGLLSQQKSRFMRLRIIRGKLIAKPRNQDYQIAASGRDDWIGWFELVKEEIRDIATENTGRIIGLLNADVQCLIEVENRTGLQHFNDDVLEPLHILPFTHVMLIDGNDERGIDVGIMTRKGFEIAEIASHVDDRDDKGIIFSRDCAEYEIETKDHNILLVMINHFKSKGYGDAKSSAEKRLRQSKRVRTLYEKRLAEGFDYIAVLGDLNEIPGQFPLDPLLREGSTLVDIMSHAKFQSDGRVGTHGNGTANSKLDYILLSPKLLTKIERAGIERRGVWGGKSGTLFPHLETMKTENDAASDHAALWVDLAI